MSDIIKPAVLVVLDGWGVAPASRGNAITLAQTPVFHKLITTYPTFTLQAAGEAVGLPWGEMGNSEVGHLTLGAGKILYQDLPRITRAILNGTFLTNPLLLKACQTARQTGSALHFVGMVSSGGVHSSNEHLYALLELAKQQQVERVFVHAILDGRDAPFNSGKKFLKDLEDKMHSLSIGKIASLAGRFYAMDRDNHWERVQAAYEAMVQAKGKPAESWNEAVTSSYEAKVYDEELVPTVLMEQGKPVAQIGAGDMVIMFNFRADRARQLAEAFSVKEFNKFARPEFETVHLITMTEYEKDLPVEVAFPPDLVAEPLAKVISDAGLNQMHLAETEKYAHVTYFFNGGREQAYPEEEHVLVPSPVVSSYDLKPEMSSRPLTARFLQELRKNTYSFFVINYASSDMVAHTGNLPASIKAIEVLDECLGELVAAVLEYNGTVFITSDHGNAEGLLNLQTGTIDKEHSATPVPFIIVSRDLEHKAVSGVPLTDDLSQLTPAGVLADVAPTILKVMGVSKPKDMTGRSLL